MARGWSASGGRSCRARGSAAEGVGRPPGRVRLAQSRHSCTPQHIVCPPPVRAGPRVGLALRPLVVLVKILGAPARACSPCHTLRQRSRPVDCSVTHAALPRRPRRRTAWCAVRGPWRGHRVSCAGASPQGAAQPRALPGLAPRWALQLRAAAAPARDCVGSVASRRAPLPSALATLVSRRSGAMSCRVTGATLAGAMNYVGTATPPSFTHRDQRRHSWARWPLSGIEERIKAAHPPAAPESPRRAAPHATGTVMDT